MDPTKGMDLKGLGSGVSSTISGLASKFGTSGFETDIKPIGQPQGKRPKKRSEAATFLGTDASPGPASGANGGATLMGS